MANIFLNVPVVVGVGAPVDISAMGAEKTIVVAGALTGALTLEISEDAGVSWSQIYTFTKTGNKVLSFAANRIRARSSTGGGVVNIGANDDGGLYVVIPPPPMNGVGVAVDISALGHFTTVAAQGDFGGGVIGIQVSENGVDFSEFATFADPDSVTNMMVGDFVRAVSRGAGVVGAPYAPVLSMGAINDSAAAPPSSTVGSNGFIYQPGGGGVGPTVFEDWATLYAALVTARAAGGVAPGGAFKIYFDDSIVTPAVVPAGAYDMDSVTLEGLWRGPHDLSTTPVGPDVDFADGVSLLNLQRMNGPCHFRSLGVVGPVSLQTAWIIGIQGASVTSVGGPFFDGSALLPGDVTALGTSEGANLGDGLSPIVSIPAGVFLALSANSSQIQENALDVAVGAILLTIPLTVSSVVADNQPAFLGTAVTILPSTWRYRNNGRHTGPATVNATVGDVVRCDPTAGDVDVDLPLITAFNDGQTVAVCNSTGAAAFAVNIAPAAGDTISDSATPYVLGLGFSTVILAADFANGNWDVVACCDQGEIEALTVRVEALEGAVTAIEGDITTIEGDITTIEGDLLLLQQRLVLPKTPLVVATAVDNHITVSIDPTNVSYWDLTSSLAGGYTFSAAAGSPIPYILPGVTGQVLVIRNSQNGNLAFVPAAGAGINVLGNVTLTMTAFDVVIFIYNGTHWMQLTPVVTLAF